MTRRPQRLLGDRYALGETIGVGGMAEVFLGLDTRLGREVAVKVLRIDLARDPLFQQRFRREAQAAASLNATCIVSVFDTGEDTVDGTRGVPWIVMEHVSGRTLRDVLRQDGPLAPEHALRVVADVCAALEVAHAAGIVHRDIKPANVMLTADGEVKVMDFGIARAVSAGTQTMTQTANVVGTAAYLSPEQALGEHVDARSDLYSTGCLLFELLTGRPPFTGDSPVSVAYQHVREDPVRPSSLDPDIGAPVDAVVLTALAKNPDNRYQSAVEMRADLLRAAAGEAVSATPLLTADALSAGSSRIGPARRRRGPLYALAALLAVAALVGAGLLVRGLVDGSHRVGTPYLVGMRQEDAQAALRDARLGVGPVTQAFSERPAGQVVAQSPAGGTRVPVGRAVDLTVSKGLQTNPVPEVVGDTRELAQAELAQARLTVGNVVQRVGNSAPDVVLEVIPAAGTPLPAGSSVTLVVATGQADVPLVVRLGQLDATSRLQQAGFTVRVRLQPASGTPGVVLSQDPVNTTAARGSTVTIVVSQTPAPRRTTPPPSPTAPSPAPTTPPPTVPPSPTAAPTVPPTPTPTPPPSP